MSNFLEMSPALAAVIPSRICNSHTNDGVFYPFPNTTQRTGLLQGGSNYPNSQSAGAYLFIMQGAVPANLSTLINPQVRLADSLVTFSTTTNATITLGDFAPTDVTTNPVSISTNYIPASATGTATWFWLIDSPDALTPTNNSLLSTTITHQVIGTVGLIGSGADLQLANVNIVAGEEIKVYNFNIQFPTSWTY